MSGSREAILGQVRQSLGRGPQTPEAQAPAEARLAAPRRNTVPARAQGSRAARIDLFVAMVEESAATVSRVGRTSEAARAVAGYLRRENLPARLVAAPDPALDDLGWDDQPTLSLRRGAADARDLVSVTGTLCGIAETGTLMLLSGPDSPTTLNFLPDTHIAVVRAADVVGAMEDGWDRARARGALPRTVNFVTGPSRSADIEQTLQLGAHGPRRLHVILVDDDEPTRQGD